ncbi:MAG: cytochrome c [Gammaproteobacteria bacterium]|nr:cytochrome c [Gammaproteobacteria bacterium]
MKKGEAGILIGIVVVVVVTAVIKNFYASTQEEDLGIPYFSTADITLAKQARKLFRKYKCYDCHSLWTKRNIMQSVPAPALDGLGSLKDEAWFYNYFSAVNPQAIVPTRLKKEFQMPSFADTPEEERRILAKYLDSLKVKDWYLDETKKRKFEKLTGTDYVP